MAGTAQHHATLFADLGAAGVQLIAELSTGEDHVQLHQQIIIVENILPEGGTFGGQGAQNALDLLLLPGLQLLALVVGLDHAHGLHKQRGPGGGHVVDKAGQAALALRLDGHHEAAVTLGDQRLLQHLGVGGGGDDALQNGAALGGGLAQLAADVPQLGAGGVGNGLLVQDGGADLLL